MNSKVNMIAELGFDLGYIICYSRARKPLHHEDYTLNALRYFDKIQDLAEENKFIICKLHSCEFF